jgi:hypothetical protein
MIGKAQKSHGARSGLYGGCSNGVPLIHFSKPNTKGEGRSVYGVLVGRPEVKRPLGRPRRRWDDNIKMDLRDIGIDGVN